MLDNGSAYRAFLINDDKLVIGTNATAANNIRLYRSAAAELSFATGDDVTAEGSTTASLASVAFNAFRGSSGSLSGYLDMVETSAPSAPAASTHRFYAKSDENLYKKNSGGTEVEVSSLFSAWKDYTTQGSSPANPSAGIIRLFYKTADGKLYQRNSAGTENTVGSVVQDYRDFAEVATPSNPSASTWRTYFKSDGNLYKLNSAGTESAITGPGTLPDSSDEITNLAISASVAASALTIAIKTKAGTDPTGTDIVKVGMRNSTLTTGTYNQRTITGALSLVISSGSTLGLVSARDEYIYVYLIDNAGTLELAAMGGAALVDEGTVVTSTTEGGAGGADTRYTLYSTTGRSNVPVRLVGRLKSNQATSGTYATSIAEIALLPFRRNNMQRSSVTLWAPNGHGSTNTAIRRYTNNQVVGAAMSYADSATNGGLITILEEGIYVISVSDSRSAASWGAGISVNSTQLTTAINSINDYHSSGEGRLMSTNGGAGLLHMCSTQERLKPGDLVRSHDDTACDNTANASKFRITKVAD